MKRSLLAVLGLSLAVLPGAASAQMEAAERAEAPAFAPTPAAASTLAAPALAPALAPISSPALSAAAAPAPALAAPASISAAAAPVSAAPTASASAVAAPASSDDRAPNAPRAAKPHSRGANAGRSSAPSAREQLEAAARAGGIFDGALSGEARDGRLGRTPSKNDPRNLLLAKYLPNDLSGVPAQANLSTPVKNWGMMLNDTIGDCTVAACGHQIQQWTANAGTEKTPTDQAILKAYEAVSGYRPGNPQTDAGADMLTVLKYWRKTGISGDKIGAFTFVDPANFDHVRAATWLFGGTYLGLAMPVSAQKQQVWDVPQGGAVGDGAPGSWGGHAVLIAGYSPEGLLVVTWGQLKLMTWDFLKTYAQEAYAIVSKDFLNGKGQTPNAGLDLAALNADLKTVADTPPAPDSAQGPRKRRP